MKALDGKKSWPSGNCKRPNNALPAITLDSMLPRLPAAHRSQGDAWGTAVGSLKSKIGAPSVWKFDALWEHPLGKGEATCHSSWLYSLCTEDTWKATARVHRVIEDW